MVCGITVVYEYFTSVGGLVPRKIARAFNRVYGNGTFVPLGKLKLAISGQM